MEIPTSIGLDKTEYELETPFFEYVKNEKNYLPEKKIVAFMSFGIGTTLCMDYKGFSSEILLMEVNNDPTVKRAKVTNIEETENQVIIQPVSIKEPKEKKIKYVNKIIEKIDFKKGFCNKVFIEMLKNLFTQERLKEILEYESPEILCFNGLMYLKIKNRAYRL